MGQGSGNRPGDTELCSRLEDFLYREARLLDDRRFDDWLALFADTATYWVPCNRNDLDPTREVSLIYDDRKVLGERVWRIQSGQAYAQSPPSVTRRIVGNVELLEARDQLLVVSSNFIVAEIRHDQQRIYAGRYEHHLTPTEEAWLILRKKVELVNNAAPLGNLTFLL